MSKSKASRNVIKLDSLVALNTADSAAINAAAIQVVITANTEIELPPGTYTVDPINLTDNIKIYGAPQGATHLIANGAGVFCNNRTGSGSAMTYVEIANIDFDGAGKKAIYQSDITAYSSIWNIHDCFFKKDLAECVYLNMIESIVRFNRFGYAGTSGAAHRHIFSQGSSGASSNQVFIEDNHFQTSIGAESVRIENGGGIHFSGNTWEGNFNTQQVLALLGNESVDIGTHNWFEGNYGPQLITLGKSPSLALYNHSVQCHGNYFNVNSAAPFLNAAVFYVTNAGDAAQQDGGVNLDFFDNYGGFSIPVVKNFAAATDDACGVLRDYYSNYYSSRSIIDRAACGTLNKELTANGDMELNSGWVDSGTPTVDERSATQAHGGTYSWKFTVNAASEGIRNNTVLPPIFKGKTYTLNYWIYPDDTTTSTVNIYGNTQYHINVTTTGITQDAWNHITIKFTALFDSSDTVLQFVSGAAEAAGTWYVDDVSLKQVAYAQPSATFANNAAAIAGGVPINGTYRVNLATDPEPLYIVH